MAINARRTASVEIVSTARGMDQGLREAKRKLRAFRRDEEREGRTKKKNSLGEGFKGAGKLLAGGAMAGAVGMLANVGAEVFNVEKALTQFQIATDKTPEQLDAFRTELNKMSRDSGLARDQLLEGAASYVALTGDADGATKGMQIFGKVANATGASMIDIAAAAAAMKNNLKIDPKDFEAAFSALHVQGKAGAVEIRELASELAGIAPTFSKFKRGTGTKGLIEMGAALQVVRQGFGSTSEAATGLQSLMTALAQNAKKLKAKRIRVYDKKGNQRDFSDIIDDIRKKKLNSTDLIDLFGRDEARRAFDQLDTQRKLWDTLIAKSSDVNAISRDSAKMQESSAGKIAAAWNNIKLSIAEAFTPERIEKFADAMGKAAVAVAKIVSGVETVLGVAQSAGEGLAKAIGGEKHTIDEEEAIDEKRKLEKRAILAMAINKGMSREGARAFVKSEVQQTAGYNSKAWDARGVEQLTAERDYVASRKNKYTDSRALLFSINNAITRASAKPEVVVKVNDQAIAKANDNSSIHRTRTGGK